MVAGTIVPKNQGRPHAGLWPGGWGSTGILLGALGIVGTELVVSGVLAPVVNNPLTFQLPYFALRTLTRMTVAYGLSLAFALAYGITAAMNERASHFMLPLLDILQSVPVLGFLPAVFVFFLTNLPGEVGQETASIILIFTGMAWAVTFGVIAGVNAIPHDIKEAAKAYGIGGVRYLRQIVLPAIYPQVIWGSLLAWGGGWYFIPVEERASFGNLGVRLPGLGFYLSDAADRGDLASALFGLLAMVAIIVAINRVVWKPLGERAERYKYETVAAPGAVAFREGRIVGGFRRYETRVASPIVAFLKYEKSYLVSLLEALHLRPRLHLAERVRFQERIARHALLGRLLSFSVFLVLLVLGISVLFSTPVPSFENAASAIATFPGFQPNPALSLVLLTGQSLIRLLIAYGIALGWTILAGIVIARREKLSKILVPIFDIGQSIPATALFPIITLLLLPNSPGVPANPLNLQVASVLLVLTGMQWYLLFNIVGAVHNLPTDVLEASSAYRVRGKRFAREILVPASFPAIIIGSMQAWGGGWNATIVSEYVSNPANRSNPYTLPGLGSTLVNADVIGSTTVVVVTILVMTMTIVVINRLVWRRLLKKAEKYKFEY